MPTRMHFPGRVEQRRKEAQERQKIYDALNVEERLALVEERPGRSRREQTRLIISLAKTDPVAEAVVESTQQDHEAPHARKRKRAS